MSLEKNEIHRLFRELNERLKLAVSQGELYLVGGAVMCLVFEARPATKDVDGYFKPAKLIREIAAQLGNEFGLDGKWLNDAVKGYFSETGKFDSFLELSNLKVLTAQPEYLLAMKCLAMRLGEEFHDLNDVRFLLRYLNIDDYNTARATIAKYYPLDRFPQKTLYALEELLAE